MISKRYNEYKQLNLPAISKEILDYWEQNEIFEKSVSSKKGKKSFVFYEGPPSANGLPGIHHVMARTIKDIFCRYKTLKGFQVKRKGGWDTHGLPVELAVEKTLGITKEDIGKKISIEDYNNACRKEVMKYKDIWEDLTKKMGYWVDMKNPYITFENHYIESVWYLLKKLYEKDLLYKGYTIQPYSWAAGTGLSSHELNYQGCYRNISDISVVAQFKIDIFNHLHLGKGWSDAYFLAWTTTPWTLPSNTALAVGKDIVYVKVKTYNPYTHKPVSVILAKDLVHHYFSEKNAHLPLESYKPSDKNIPWQMTREFKGSELENIRYEQLLPYSKPKDGDAFKVILGDFVSTEDGTGIVHIAPSFGADDFRVAKQYGIGSLTLVDKQGKFVDEVTDFKGRQVKTIDDGKPDYESTDLAIAIKLKKENKAFKIEKYEHSYPHCWRTDQPIIYYPLDSWFIRTTTLKERMLKLNKTINWKPDSTGSGRFGNWLENLVDWNLSRSRFWGIPLPVWKTEDGTEQICIGSLEELKKEVEKAHAAGFSDLEIRTSDFDLHRPFVDEIVLLSPSGKKMYRESDLIDVWFDSGAMPFAQWGAKDEKDEQFRSAFPADFIAEGVDQTRGWFFTLHAIAVMLFDSVAFKNVISNGLVLDKAGNKMSKRLGNAVDPFETIEKYGPDATRWYMVTNAQPWDNLKFDNEGVAEVQRGFFRTLYNTYAFFALYANIDGFTHKEKEIPVNTRPEIDRWILSELHSLIKETDNYYKDYEPTKAGRAIESFVDKHLSNWYVRLCRRRFWKGDYSEDKIAAYQTLYYCMEVVLQLAAPIAPFFTEKLFLDLNNVTRKRNKLSVHLTGFPKYNKSFVNKPLEERMELAQQISSMVLSLRKKVNIRVRQPLNKILIPVPDDTFRDKVESIKSLILSEVNVKELEYVTDTKGIVVKKIRPNYKELGKKAGSLMKPVAVQIGQFTQDDIERLEKDGKYTLSVDDNLLELLLSDVEIISEDIPGWLVANTDKLTVALDVHVSPQLKEEGIARELVNRIQNIRKEKNFEVTDKIALKIQEHEVINAAVSNNLNYICSETLATSLELVKNIHPDEGQTVEIADEVTTLITINKYTNGNNGKITVQ